MAKFYESEHTQFMREWLAQHPEQRDETPLAHRQRHVVERLQRAERMTDPGNGEGVGHLMLKSARCVSPVVPRMRMS